MSPFRNPLLLLGTLAAQAIHIGALYTPGLSELLEVQPVTFDQWIWLLKVALVLVVVMEFQKLTNYLRTRRRARRNGRAAAAGAR